MIIHVDNLKEVTERIKSIKAGLISPVSSRPDVKSSGGVRPAILRLIEVKKRLMVAASINRRQMVGSIEMNDRSKSILRRRITVLNEAICLLEMEREKEDRRW